MKERNNKVTRTTNNVDPSKSNPDEIIHPSWKNIFFIIHKTGETVALAVEEK